MRQPRRPSFSPGEGLDISIRVRSREEVGWEERRRGLSDCCYLIFIGCVSRDEREEVGGTVVDRGGIDR